MHAGLRVHAWACRSVLVLGEPSAACVCRACACALDFPSQQTFHKCRARQVPRRCRSTRAPSTRPPPACYAPPPPSSSAARLAVGTPRRPLPPRRCRCGDRSMRCHLSAPPLSIAMASSAQAHAQAMVQALPAVTFVAACSSLRVRRRVASRMKRASSKGPSAHVHPI